MEAGAIVNSREGHHQRYFRTRSLPGLSFEYFERGRSGGTLCSISRKQNVKREIRKAGQWEKKKANQNTKRNSTHVRGNPGEWQQGGDPKVQRKIAKPDRQKAKKG